MPLYSLTNFKKYYRNEPNFNGVYLGNNLSKIKNGAYIRSLGEYESIRSHWIALYVNSKKVTNFDSFGGKKLKSSS